MQKKFNGECGDAFEAKKCDHVCDSQNGPNVCGCNREYCNDFASECEMRKYNCDHDYGMMLANDEISFNSIIYFSIKKCSQRKLQGSTKPKCYLKNFNLFLKQ